MFFDNLLSITFLFIHRKQSASLVTFLFQILEYFFVCGVFRQLPVSNESTRTVNDRRQSGAAQEQNSLKNAAHDEEQVGLKYRRRRRRRRDARRRRLRVLVDGGRVLTCKTKR